MDVQVPLIFKLLMFASRYHWEFTSVEVALFPVLLMVKVVSTNLPFHTLNTEAV
jgi:DNA topoisomerase VI subunit B